MAHPEPPGPATLKEVAYRFGKLCNTSRAIDEARRLVVQFLERRQEWVRERSRRRANGPRSAVPQPFRVGSPTVMVVGPPEPPAEEQEQFSPADKGPLLPLPPDLSGEHYTFDEVITALVILHDVKSRRQPIITKSAVTKHLCDSGFHTGLSFEYAMWRRKAEQATDDWAGGLEDLLDRWEDEWKDNTGQQGTAGGKSRRRGRKKADWQTVQKETQLANEWRRARDGGTYKADFASDKNIALPDLDRLLDRVAARKKASE